MRDKLKRIRLIAGNYPSITVCTGEGGDVEFYCHTSYGCLSPQKFKISERDLLDFFGDKKHARSNLYVSTANDISVQHQGQDLEEVLDVLIAGLKFAARKDLEVIECTRETVTDRLRRATV